MENTTSVLIKWGNIEFSVSYANESSLAYLKQKIQESTNVPAERQKIMGIKYNPQVPAESVLLSSLNLKPNQKLMVTGTADKLIEKVENLSDDVVDDLEWQLEDLKIHEQPIYIEKVQMRAKDYKPSVLNLPREGKKLLVLDIDYTFYDMSSTASNPLVLRRPFIEHLLEKVYPFYDIIIWSANSMKWIEIKMKELQLESCGKWRITAHVDGAAMITVDTSKYGVINIKPLPLIWKLFKGFYSKSNTIMFDDLGRNFLMNPENGLKIKAFRHANTEGAKDKELFYLTDYLLFLHEKKKDLSSVNHNEWHKYVSKK